MSTQPKNSVATTVGWVNPDTNEILAVRRDLPDALPFVNGRIVWPKKEESKSQETKGTKKGKKADKHVTVDVEPVMVDVPTVSEEEQTPTGE